MASTDAEHVRQLLRRDLAALEKELSAYPSDEAVWELRPGIANSAGTLALHAAGNLLHYVGALLGGSDYVRERDREFSDRGLSRDELRGRLKQADRAVDEVLSSLPAERLAEPFPEPPARYAGVSTGFFLVHLSSHLAYHLGQVNYHRRLTT